MCMCVCVCGPGCGGACDEDVCVTVHLCVWISVCVLSGRACGLCMLGVIVRVACVGGSVSVHVCVPCVWGVHCVFMLS
ncbi:hypothetical protein KI387_013239, partial [Taxus chinensis]